MNFKIRYFLPTALILAAASPLCAQELHESVTVKGQYDIDIVKTDKLYNLPQKISFAPPKFKLDYNLNPEIIINESWYNPLVPPGYKDKMIFDRHRGYLDVASGSFLNTTISAGYRFIDKPDFSLSAMIQHTSTSLFHPHPSPQADDIKRTLYDETVGVRADKYIESLGNISAEAYYRLAYFNYYGILTPLYGPDKDKAPTQTLNDVTFRAALSSQPIFGSEKTFGYHASASYRYFGYRALYDFIDPRTLLCFKGSRESDLQIAGGISKTLSPTAALGLDANLNFLFYSGGEFQTENYASLDATPYFLLSAGNLSLKAGVNVAYTFDFNNDLNSYSKFHLAPDVRLDWKYKAFGLYIKGGGGVKLQTLANLSELDFYQCPQATPTQPAVTPIDARLGFTFGPWGGFTAGISAAYQYSQNILCGGWYMNSLAYPTATITPDFMNIHGFSFGTDLSYSPAEWISAKASGSWQLQSGRTGVFNGYDRPEWTIDSELTLHPFISLSHPIAQSIAFNIGYDYRGNRTIYGFREGVAGEEVIFAHHLNDITDLSVGASVGVSKNFTIYAKGLNLLGCRSAILPMQNVEGAGFLVGFDWKF